MIICTLIDVTLSTTRRGRVGIGKLALQIAFAFQHLFWCKSKIGHPVMRPQKTQIFSFFSSKRRKALQIQVVISNAFKQMPCISPHAPAQFKAPAAPAPHLPRIVSPIVLGRGGRGTPQDSWNQAFPEKRHRSRS